jgi:hypothetical protein
MHGAVAGIDPPLSHESFLFPKMITGVTRQLIEQDEHGLTRGVLCLDERDPVENLQQAAMLLIDRGDARGHGIGPPERSCQIAHNGFFFAQEPALDDAGSGIARKMLPRRRRPYCEKNSTHLTLA